MAYDLRQQSDYEVYAVAEEDQVKNAVERAESFVAAVKKVVRVQKDG